VLQNTTVAVVEPTTCGEERKWPTLPETSIHAQQQAHRKAVKTTYAELVATLVEAFGRTLVAFIGGVDPKTVDRWAEGTNPRPEGERRVRTAFQVYQLLLSRESEHTVRAWFIGLNPQLDDISPAQALRDDQTKEVLVAAKSFTLGG
jgi:hypothetical protein